MASSRTVGPPIGHRLRSLRALVNQSLDKTAEHTGVSKAMLGQIERGESSPTIATLWKIATGLDVPLSYFLMADDRANAGAARPENAADWHEDAVGMRTRALFAFDATLGFEMFIVEFRPGACSTSPAHAPGTVEQIVMLEGKLIVTFDDQSHLLRAGDTLQFSADTPHRYQNPGSVRACAHDLIHYRR